MADELQDLTHEFHSSKVADIPNLDVNRAMSVRSKHKNTPPTDDPSNPPTAQKEAAMEQTLLMAKNAKAQHVLLPSQGYDVVHGS